MRKALVTGASGFLGWNLVDALSPHWACYGTVWRHPFKDPRVRIASVDLTNFRDLKALFRETAPDAVFHTAAISDINYCENNPGDSQRINLDMSVNIAGLCGDHGIPCVFTSSDLVFDGTQAPYKENDEPFPINRYGEHKVFAEIGMRARCPDLTICRLPLMFGDAGPVACSFLQPLLKKMREGVPIPLFTDEYRTPISGADAAGGLLLALEHHAPLWHLAGPKVLSRFEFGRAIAEIFEVPNAQLRPCLRRDVSLPAARQENVALDSSLAASYGFQAKSPQDAIADLYAKCW